MIILQWDLKPKIKQKITQNNTGGKGLKIFTPKQILQWLPVALAQVKAGNNSQNLLSTNNKTEEYIQISAYKKDTYNTKKDNNLLTI